MPVTIKIPINIDAAAKALKVWSDLLRKSINPVETEKYMAARSAVKSVLEACNRDLFNQVEQRVRHLESKR